MAGVVTTHPTASGRAPPSFFTVPSRSRRKRRRIELVSRESARALGHRSSRLLHEQCNMQSGSARHQAGKPRLPRVRRLRGNGRERRDDRFEWSPGLRWWASLLVAVKQRRRGRLFGQRSVTRGGVDPWPDLRSQRPAACSRAQRSDMQESVRSKRRRPENWRVSHAHYRRAP